MAFRRSNQWKIDRELALRRDREINQRAMPGFDEKAADRRLAEGIERLRRSLERDRQNNKPPF